MKQRTLVSFSFPTIKEGTARTAFAKQALNCWEFKKCGREPGGVRAVLLGVCPASTNSTYSNVNRGVNAGRYCWRVAGTFCEGKIEGLFAFGLLSCSFCDFYRLVQESEGGSLQL